MFKIKICGVTRAVDLAVISAAGADAIGINLVASSPRCVALHHARYLTDLASDYGLRTFVVVMNPTCEQLAEIVDRVEPDGVQLHGQELPTIVSDKFDVPIIKALSWSGRSEETELASAWLAANLPTAALSFLVDAYAPGVGGGTGRVAKWDLLTPRPAMLDRLPMLLAGGLTATNVSQAISATACDGVDAASGVETSPGVKDAKQVEAFVNAAREAFARRDAQV